MSKRTALVSGSFDPITKGHLYVVEEALKMADEVIVLVANNPDKRYHFTLDKRRSIIQDALTEHFESTQSIKVQAMPNAQFTAKLAHEMGASLVVRGLRNVVDFEYEHSQQLINRVIAPDVTTVFVMPPTDLIAVSSSMIKGMVGIDGWEEIASLYIPCAALAALKERTI